MTYISTPEKDAAQARMDSERKQRCEKILERYEQRKLAERQALIAKDEAQKQKAAIAFQTGRKFR